MDYLTLMAPMMHFLNKHDAISVVFATRGHIFHSFAKVKSVKRVDLTAPLDAASSYNIYTLKIYSELCHILNIM